MKRNFYIGVDGGATKCTVRLEDEQSQLLGRETGGPATLRFSAEQVWESVLTTLNKILQQQSLSLNEANFHIGMGLAGSEISENYQAFIQHQHPFKTCQVASDAHTACLGAHGAVDGAIIIAGTGVVGYQLEQGVATKVGGFGFPHDDEGGGAWLGLQAVRKTVQWLDGRAAASALAQAVFERFQQNAAALITWANNANGTLFAELAPLVITQSQQQDSAAICILQDAAKALDHIAMALQRAQAVPTQPLPCALIGGVAPFLAPYLSEQLRGRLVSMVQPPDVGAILLARTTHVTA